MHRVRTALLLAPSLFVCAVAQAQEAPPPPADTNASGGGDEIIVTGTRTQGRSRLESAAPVDVLSASSLRQQGTPELATALATLTPSIDFPRPSANDGSDAIRPATLRGLSPDETLVLINGVRAHSSAYLNVNGSIGRGAAAVDLNTVPTVALESVEVLRDGASAQYGSDAIAGVVNLRLRKASSGGGASASYGFYDTRYDGAHASHSSTGEGVVSASLWKGLSLGEGGWLTLSGDFQHRAATSRGDVDPRLPVPAVNNRYGDPEVDQYTGYANFGKSFGDWEGYGWVGYQYRKSTSAAFPRLAGAAAGFGLATLYPNGFLPLIESRSRDLNTALGLRGTLAGWSVDLHAGYGRNAIALRTLNSANYTVGAATQTNFYDGKLTYDQWTGGLDVTRKFDALGSLNVAWGVEGRREGYRISPGEPASYGYGTAFPTATPGAQGYGGLSPLNAVNAHRSAVSGYLDLEAQPVQALLIGLAGRVEHYSDFGDTANGKVSLRYDVAPWLALRGTVSTGFRAPSLQQQYYTSIASVINSGAVQLTGTYPSTAGVAAALGGLPLRPEKSTNYSAGFVVRAGGLDLTVDGYWIKLRDALALSENISAGFSPQVAALLAPFPGVQAARFFINGIRLQSRGIDAVAHYRLRTEKAGTFDFTLAGNVNKLTVDAVPTSTAVALNPAPTLFARSRYLTLEKGTPGEKLTGSVEWSGSRIGATAHVTWYGNATVPGSTAAADYVTGSHAITDLELRYQPQETPLKLALGVNNLFDVYPDATPAALNNNGVVAFPYFSPFGFNGRFLYVRAELRW
ncbi:MAG: TonB-dependent receptor [Sphingomonadales bacterium]|nr:TonB-dependent receptor [Sphingomonadales bacterium]